MRALISVDPGNHAGWAVIGLTEPPTLLRWGLYDFQNKDFSKPWNPHSPSFLIKWLIETFIAKGVEITTLVIENQYVGKDADLAIRLAQLAGHWQEAARANSLDSIMVEPSRWQAAVLFKGDYETKYTRQERKDAAVELCKRYWKQSLTQDVADAAVLGLYAVRILNRTSRPFEKAG